MKHNTFLAMMILISASFITVSCTTQSDGNGSQNTSFLDPNRSQKNTPLPNQPNQPTQPTNPTHPNQPTQPTNPTHPNQPTYPGGLVLSCAMDEICVEFNGPVFAAQKEVLVKNCTEEEHGKVVALCPANPIGFCTIAFGAADGTPNAPQSSGYKTKFYGEQDLATLEHACKQAGGQFGH